MSKASEWAKLVKTPAPKFRFGQSCFSVAVTTYGEMGLYDGDETGQDAYALKPDQALALADWIYDTFGEAEKPPASSTGSPG